VPVIARVNHARNIENIYRAGADYALSISDISGEMLSARLLGRAVRTREEHRKVMRMRSSIARPLRELSIRKYGCSVIALSRNGTFVTQLNGQTEINAGDELYICGNDEALRSIAL
jgi:Trk K+ transport system NAD-binding subunit